MLIINTNTFHYLRNKTLKITPEFGIKVSINNE